MPNPKARTNDRFVVEERKREREHSILEGTFTKIIFLNQQLLLENNTAYQLQKHQTFKPQYSILCKFET